MSAQEHLKYSYEFHPEALVAPVPNMDDLRRIKIGYSDVPIDSSNELYHEPVIALSSCFLAGQSYYSRPNAATVDPVPGVDPNQYLRVSVARTLKEIDDYVQNDDITEFFGRPVGLYVEDALRPVSLQKKLYDEVFPKLIREQNPGISDEAMVERRKDLIAKPSTDPNRPSPHATGGVFDLALHYLDDDGQISDVKVEMGHEDGNTDERVNPDYYETHEPTNDQERLAQRNRRAFYAIMTGAAFGIETGFVNNPTEFWHWGRGDQLSARVSSQESAVYSLAETPESGIAFSGLDVAATLASYVKTESAPSDEATSKKQAIMQRAHDWAESWAHSLMYVEIGSKKTELLNVGSRYFPEDTPENRRRLQDEIDVLKNKQQQALVRGMSSYEELYDIDPDRVDPNDDASIEEFKQAGSAYERLNSREEEIDRATEVVNKYIDILTSSVQNPEMTSRDIEKAMDEYGKSLDIKFLSSGNVGFSVLKHVITYAYFARGHQGRLDGEAAIASLSKDLSNNWDPFSVKGKATEAWLIKLQLLLADFESMRKELPSMKTRFIERYAGGEKLSGMNAVDERLDADGRLK